MASDEYCVKFLSRKRDSIFGMLQAPSSKAGFQRRKSCKRVSLQGKGGGEDTSCPKAGLVATGVGAWNLSGAKAGMLEAGGASDAGAGSLAASAATLACPAPCATPKLKPVPVDAGWEPKLKVGVD